MRTFFKNEEFENWKGDILLGDRVYAAPLGVAHVLAGGGDVIVRLNRMALPLFDDHHGRIDLAAQMRTLKGHSPAEFSSWIEDSQGGWIAGRMVDTAASFFPWGYPVAAPAQPMAGN